LSPIDTASLDNWEEYTRSEEAMFAHTDTADAPWTVIKSDCKKRAPDPLIVGPAHVVYERGERQGDPIL